MNCSRVSPEHLLQLLAQIFAVWVLLKAWVVAHCLVKSVRGLVVLFKGTMSFNLHSKEHCGTRLRPAKHAAALHVWLLFICRQTVPQCAVTHLFMHEKTKISAAASCVPPAALQVTTAWRHGCQPY